MNDEPRSDQEREELPRPAPESGLPGGSNSVVGDKVPPGSQEAVKEELDAADTGRGHGEVAPGDEYGSRLGASAAMGEAGDENSDESHGGPSEQ